MPDLQSPWKRSIGLKGITRFAVTVAAVVAVVAALMGGDLLLGIAAVLFVLAALVIQYLAARARRPGRGGG